MTEWIILLAWMEYYSIGLTLLAKKTGKKHYGMYLIPFVSHFFIDSITGGFRIVTIPVKKWGKTVLIFAFVVVIAQIGCNWAEATLVPEMAGYFAEIMFLPVFVCGLVYWLGTIASTLKIMDNLFIDFLGAGILAALLLPIPFMLLHTGKSDEKEKSKSCG